MMKEAVRTSLLCGVAWAMVLGAGCRATAPEEPAAAGDEATADGQEAAAGEDVVQPDTLARVNGTVVLTRAALDAELDSIVRRYEAAPGRGATTAQWRNERRQRIVQNAVQDYMVGRHIRERGIRMTDEEVLERLRQEHPHVFANAQAFERYLAAQHMTREQYLNQQRLEYGLNQLLEERGEASPGDEEIEEFYQRNRERWRAQERVLLSTILLRLRPDAPPAEVEAARERLNQARQRVRAGEDFATVAREISEGAERELGGDMGWVMRGRQRLMADAEIEASVFATAVGEVTTPVRTIAGLQIFHVRDHRPEGVRDLDEVRSAIEAPLRRRQRQRLRIELVQELREQFGIELFEDNWGLEPADAAAAADDAAPADDDAADQDDDELAAE